MFEVIKTWAVALFFLVGASVTTTVLAWFEQRVDRPVGRPSAYVYTGDEPPEAFALVDKLIWTGAPLDELAGEYEVPGGHAHAGALVWLDRRTYWRLLIDRLEGVYVECAVEPAERDGWHAGECARVVDGVTQEVQAYRVYVHRSRSSGRWLRVQVGNLLVVEALRRNE